jgi:putative oxidoreductase
MTSVDQRAASKDVAYAIMRMVIGLNFATHGAQKLFGVFGAPPETSVFLGHLAGVIEFGGGLMIATGLFTGPAAFIASGEMAVAYFRVHIAKGFWPILNGGEKAVMYCFVLLFIAASGPGIWSLARLRARFRPAAELRATAD